MKSDGYKSDGYKIYAPGVITYQTRIDLLINNPLLEIITGVT